MEYTVIEGLKKNSSNYFCEGFRYIKARESESCIYVKCSLFRTQSCECYGKINKSANLLEISTFHNHEAGAYTDLPTVQGFCPFWLFCTGVQGFSTPYRDFLVETSVLIVS